MAHLRSEGLDVVHLQPSTLIGRAPHCALRIEDASVSREHARIFWSGAAWVLKDLGSDSRSYIDGCPLQRGECALLDLDARIAFGACTDTWQLESDAPPVARAQALHNGAEVLAFAGFLCLPDTNKRVALIHQAPDGQWLLERQSEARPIVNDEVITAGGVNYRLLLPSSTSIIADPIALDFDVSMDEEHIEITALSQSARHVLRARSHNEVILHLARARLRDAESGLAEAEHGWLYAESVCDDLKLDQSRLNLDIHRFRKQLEAVGISGAQGIVERRVDSRQLRIGTSRLHVRSVR